MVLDQVDPLAQRGAGDHREDEGAGLFGRELLLGEREELPPDARAHDLAAADVDVAGAALHGAADDLFHRSSGVRSPGPCGPRAERVGWGG